MAAVWGQYASLGWLSKLSPQPSRHLRKPILILMSSKAALLLRGITQGHPFHDGNKRTGFLTATYYLARVGYTLRADLDKVAVITFCRHVSAGDIRDPGTMAEALAEWFTPRETSAG
jgi:prophage maintenance system killer protein